VAARIGTITDWPLILMTPPRKASSAELSGPYIAKRYLGAGDPRSRRAAQGRRVSPVEPYGVAQIAPFRRLQGLSMIAVSGLDMAAWDALAKAAGMRFAPFSAAGGRGEGL
jgi:mandelate racemase